MDARIRQTLAKMEANLHRKFSPPHMAEAVHLSESRFTHLFTAETGSSPRRYLKRRRLEKARELLETSDLPVKEITAVVGLLDVSHFVRDFETSYGLSPRRYRGHFCRARLVGDTWIAHMDKAS